MMWRRRLRLSTVWLGLFVLIFYMFDRTLPEENEFQLTVVTTSEPKVREKRDDSELSDVAPWQLFTAGSLWDSSQRSPQQGRSGALHADLLTTVDAAVQQLNRGSPTAGRSDQQQQPYTRDDLLDGRYRHQPGRGSEYVLSFASRRPGRLETVRLARPAGVLSAAGSASPATAATVRLVVPYYHRPDVFGAFLANVAHLVLQAREPLQMVVVFYWRGSPAAGLSEVQRDRARVAEALRQLNRRARRPVARLLDQKRTFSRGHALLRGADAAVGLHDGDGDDDVLLFFCDIDMFFDADALRRCRSNAVPGRSVYYPIVFSTFSPMLRAVAWDQPQTSLWKEHPIDPNVGFWRDFGYGMTCQFRSDFQRAAGDYLISDSWGGEDKRLFKHHQLTGIEIVRAPDPGLVHVHHDSRCDPNQTRDKYKWCMQSQMMNEASADTWAFLIRRLQQRHVKVRGEQAASDGGQSPVLDNVCEKYIMDTLELIR